MPDPGIRSDRIMLGTVFGFQREANLSFLPEDLSNRADGWVAIPLIHPQQYRRRVLGFLKG
jgi:hypothetical protein